MYIVVAGGGGRTLTLGRNRNVSSLTQVFYVASRSNPCPASKEVAASDRVAFQASHGSPCAA